MKVLDPGHSYRLASIAEEKDRASIAGDQSLHFVKRIGEGYPGNVAPGRDGAIVQEVLRACIDRLKYVNAQIPCWQTTVAIHALRLAFYMLEARAAKRHGLDSSGIAIEDIDLLPACALCGHIRCKHSA